MNLLILTQKVDKDDPILGFFHRWIQEFANHCDKLTVICLQKGEYNLPANVKVLSLGKEGGVSKLKYLCNFYRYIWRERKNYDTVFVHMNQEYVLLGAVVWKLLGKKILLWRNHPRGNWLTRLAVWLADQVFCTSEFSFTARFSKTKIMPVGIDTEMFKRNPLVIRQSHSLLFLGRMSPIKRPEILIEALHLLDSQVVDFTAVFVGDPLPKDKNYYQSLGDLVKKYQLAKKVQFIKGVPNEQTPVFYNSYEIFVNLTPTGSFDKTILEAMACEALVLTSNRFFSEVLNQGLLFREGDSSDLATKILTILNLAMEEKTLISKQLRIYVVNNHNLTVLVEKLVA